MRFELSRAIRRLRQRPAPALTGAVTLALGIGASTAAFSAVRAVVLEPLPVEDQDRVAVLWQRSAARGFDHVPFLPSALDELTDFGGPFEEVTAVPTTGAFVVPGEGPDGTYAIRQTRVGGDFFGMLGVEPSMGVLLAAADDEVGAAPNLVLSHGYWTRVHGARPEVVGSTLRVGGVSYTVVGVAPPDFDYPRGTEAWVTLRGSFPEWATNPVDRFELDLVVRLGEGVDIAEAAAAVDGLFRGRPELSALAADLETVGMPFVDVVVGEVRPVLVASLAAGFALLLVAVANATLLFLAGGARSLRDSALRRALGAAGFGVVRPLLADAALQATLGVLGGVLIAKLALVILLPLAPQDFARFEEITLHPSAVLFAGILGTFALLASAGLTGSWLARRDPATLMRGSAQSTATAATFRRGLAAGQVGLAVVAAVGALLLIQTVLRLDRLDRGFDADGLVLVTFQLPPGTFDGASGFPGVLRSVADGLGARPEILGVSPTFNAPLVLRAGFDFAPRIDAQSQDDAQGNPYVGFDAVLPEYFEVVGTELRAGRLFGPEDGPEDAPVLIVNEAAAEALWPGEDPIGHQVFMGGLSRDEWRTVVGVVENHRFRSFPDAHPAVYLPSPQYERFTPSRLLVRISGSPDGLREAVEAEFARTFGAVSVITIEEMTEVMRRPLARPRFAATTLLALALATVVLAGLGVHGVLAVLVAERRRELGVRVALGARPIHVARHVARHLVWIGVVGGVVGAVGCVWVAASLDALLYGDAPAMAPVIPFVLAAAIGLAFTAGVGPTLRATRADPAATLRVE